MINGWPCGYGDGMSDAVNRTVQGTVCLVLYEGAATMGLEGVISALGLGGLIADQAFLAQIGLMAVSSILFLSSIIVCAMAFSAAGAARRARREALDLAVEVRHLTAQVEKAAHRSGAPSRGDKTAEAAVVLSASGEGEPSDKTEAAETETRTLEEAKNAATVPSALLRRMVRRRR